MFGRSFVWWPRRAVYAGYPGTATNGWVWLQWSYWELIGAHRIYYPDK